MNSIRQEWGSHKLLYMILLGGFFGFEGAPRLYGALNGDDDPVIARIEKLEAHFDERFDVLEATASDHERRLTRIEVSLDFLHPEERGAVRP